MKKMHFIFRQDKMSHFLQVIESTMSITNWKKPFYIQNYINQIEICFIYLNFIKYWNFIMYQLNSILTFKKSLLYSILYIIKHLYHDFCYMKFYPTSSLREFHFYLLGSDLSWIIKEKVHYIYNINHILQMIQSTMLITICATIRQIIINRVIKQIMLAKLSCILFI